MTAKNRNVISLASLLFDIGTDVFLITAKQVAMRRLKQQSTSSINNALPSFHLVFHLSLKSRRGSLLCAFKYLLFHFSEHRLRGKSIAVSLKNEDVR